VSINAYGERGKNIIFRRGGINIVFGKKYRPLCFRKYDLIHRAPTLPVLSVFPTRGWPSSVSLRGKPLCCSQVSCVPSPCLRVVCLGAVPWRPVVIAHVTEKFHKVWRWFFEAFFECCGFSDFFLAEPGPFIQFDIAGSCCLNVTYIAQRTSTSLVFLLASDSCIVRGRICKELQEVTVNIRYPNSQTVISRIGLHFHDGCCGSGSGEIIRTRSTICFRFGSYGNVKPVYEDRRKVLDLV
jgi:hypothetical protein